MAKVITLSGLVGRMGVETLPEEEPIGGSCASKYSEEITIDGKLYCKSIETGRIYDAETGEEYIAKVPSSKLLVYGISAGAGLLVGVIVAATSAKKNKGTMMAVGAGVGAATGAVLLAMTWPKEEEA